MVRMAANSRPDRRFEVNGSGALLGASLLLVVVLGVGVVDLAALLSRGQILTVTEVVQLWSREWPIIPFAVGVIIGHLFFPVWVYGVKSIDRGTVDPRPPVTERPKDMVSPVYPAAAGAAKVRGEDADPEGQQLGRVGPLMTADVLAGPAEPGPVAKPDGGPPAPAKAPPEP